MRTDPGLDAINMESSQLHGMGMFDSSTLFASLLWGSLGSVMFMYGWKQKSVLPLGAGLLLAGISYFIESAMYMTQLAGTLICVAMYWLKRQGY